MTDETATVRRIIVDCIDAELRWNANAKADSPLAVAERIAQEIMLKFASANIRTVRESYPQGDGDA